LLLRLWYEDFSVMNPLINLVIDVQMYIRKTIGVPVRYVTCSRNTLIGMLVITRLHLDGKT
jgi:hypothetical protein